MPPSGTHRQPFVRYRHVRRQDPHQTSSTSHASQEAQVFPLDSEVDRQSQVGTSTAVAGATVTIVVVVCLLVFSAAFFLIRYGRKRRKTKSPTVPDHLSWTEVASSTPIKEKRFTFGEGEAERGSDVQQPESVHLSGKERRAVISDEPQSPSPLAVNPPDMDEKQASSLGFPFNSHLSSFTFNLPSPMNPAPTRDSRVFDVDPVSRHESLLDECMNSLMADESVGSPVPRLGRGRRRPESEDSSIINEQSWWSNDSTRSSSAPPTPEKVPVKDPDGHEHDHSDTGDSEKPGWELLTKLRKFLPSTPPSLKSSITFDSASSSVAVRRSFTSPAFFTMVTPANNPAICLKPCVPDKRESVTSNYFLAFIEGQSKLGLDLMDEALPPPAIIVSPPTVSTFNLCRQSMISLGQFADAVDPWSIAYGMPPNLYAGSTPAAFDVELSRRRGGPSVARPPRPPKSRRRTYVQREVEAC